MLAPRPLATLSMALLVFLAAGPAGLAQVPKVAPPIPRADAKAKPAVKAEPVNLNSGTADELMTLPGIGEAYSRKIIESRPHKEVADLAKLGVPSKTVDGLKGLAVVRPLPSPVNVNADPILRLETLPGVGPALAKEIVAGRPYASYEDLTKVKGIGPAKLDGLRGRLKFGKGGESKEATPKKKAAAVDEPKAAPGSKVHLNTASKDQLDALPGIGPVRAQAIIEGRPFGSIEDVMKVKGIKEVEFAKIKDLITVR